MRNDFNTKSDLRGILRLDIDGIQRTLFGDTDINTDTKTALIVAQTAEKILQLTEKIEHVLEHGDADKKETADKINEKQEPWKKTVRAKLNELHAAKDTFDKAIEKNKDEAKNNIDIIQGELYALQRVKNNIDKKHSSLLKSSWGNVDLGKFIPELKSDIEQDDVFLLKASKTTYLAAQMYLNNEIDAKTAKDDYLRVTSIRNEYVSGLRKQAAYYYHEAGQMMHKAGQPQTGDALKETAGKIEYATPVLPPHKLVAALFSHEDWNVGHANQSDEFSIPFDHRDGYEPEHCKNLIKTLKTIEQDKIIMGLERGVQTDIDIKRKVTFKNPARHSGYKER